MKELREWMIVIVVYEERETIKEVNKKIILIKYSVK